MVRLYLKGLEGFTVSNEQFTVDRSEVSVSVYDKKGCLYGKKYLLNEIGYYEVKLPNRLFTDRTTEIIIHWVDFYR